MAKSPLFLLFLIVFSIDAMAVRPFITDDARVVGRRLGQYETWFRFDKHSSQHWNMLAYGPNSKWEIAIGMVHGLHHPEIKMKPYSIGIPLLQIKYLLKEYKANNYPGIAVAAGTFLPFGNGVFKAPGYGIFAYTSLTQCLGKKEELLIHANLGTSYVNFPEENYSILTWGLGSQIKAYKGLHIVAEIFSGDPYVPNSGIAFQTGFRHIVNNNIQLDLTLGKGIDGKNKLPFWYGFGVRLVSNEIKIKSF